MKNTWILGVETSTSLGSLALKSLGPEDNSQFEISWGREASHSEVITAKAKELFDQAKITPAEVSAIACGCGPGSFTGIRVAINFAKTLAFSYDLKIWTIDTLRILAQQAATPGKDLLCAIDAFRDLIYCSEFTCDNNAVIQTVKKPFVTTAEGLANSIDKPFIVAGSTFDTYWSDFSHKHTLLQKSNNIGPSALALIEASQSQNEVNTTFNWKTAKPLYIRASEAEEKLKSGELKPQKTRN